MLTEWNFRTRGKACAICGRAFEAGDACVSALNREADGTFSRLDACAACEPAARTEAQSSISHWRFTFRPPEAQGKAKPAVERDNAETLFLRLLTEDDPASRDAAYVLAVMLERARVLIPRGTENAPGGDGLLRIYEHRTHGTAFIVRDPMLSLDRIGPVQRHVADLLAL